MKPEPSKYTGLCRLMRKRSGLYIRDLANVRGCEVVTYVRLGFVMVDRYKIVWKMR